MDALAEEKAKSARRLRAGFIAMAVLAVAALGGFGWAYYSFREAKSEKERADYFAEEAKKQAIAASKQETIAKGLAVVATKQKEAADTSAAEATKQKGIADALAADARLKENQAKQKLFDDNIVTDKATGLTWTRTDNFEDIDWNGAERYCKELTLVDFSGWRLPTIDELEKLYDPKTKNANRIRKPFRLSGLWVWSSEKSGSGSAWPFSFAVGGRHTHAVDYSNGLRALCVRRSGG